MLTAKLVRLDTAWSATPQLSRCPTRRARCHGTAVRPRLTAAVPPLVASTIMSGSVSFLGHRRVDGLAGSGERGADLAAQHVVDQPAPEQLLDPPQPHVARAGEVVVGQVGVGG